MSAGGLLLLASLYLPWQTASCSDEYFAGQGGTTCGLLHLFSGSGSNDGLSSEVGSAAALFAVLLAALAGAAWARPSLAPRLPLGTCALLAAYFGLAVAVLTRSDAPQEGFDVRYASGAYVGLAAMVVMLAGAVLARRAELASYRSSYQLLMLALVGGLLAAFLLPWWELRDAAGYHATFLGISRPAAMVAATLALSLPAFRPTSAERLGLAAAAVFFTGAAGSDTQFAPHAHGFWLALGLAGALVALVLVQGVRTLRESARTAMVREPSWHKLATGAAAALFLGALFLPWQRQCYEAGKGFGPLGGHCLSWNVWATYPLLAAATAVLATALVVTMNWPRRLPLPTRELAVGFGLLVLTLGFALDEGGSDGFRQERAYGSTIGLTLAGALVVLGLVRLRLPIFDRKRFLVRVAPIAACAGYLAILVLPWWQVLPGDAFEQVSLTFAPFSWLTIAGMLLGIHLLGLWTRQVAGASARADLVLLPLALLALAAVDLIAQRERAFRWVTGAVVALCLLLAALGRMERRGGLESFRVPEALRLDRL